MAARCSIYFALEAADILTFFLMKSNASCAVNVLIGRSWMIESFSERRQPGNLRSTRRRFSKLYDLPIRWFFVS